MRDIKITLNTTNRIRSTEKYFNEIKYPVLTPEREVELFTRYKNGDQKAKELIIQSNLRFVITTAKQYAPKHDPDVLMDMIQEGNLGLAKAVETFDTTRGFKFISYAVWHIRQRILLYINENSTVRYSMNIVQDRSKIKKIYDKLEVVLERKPTDEEVFEEYCLLNNKRQSPFSELQIRNKIKTFLVESGDITSLDQAAYTDSSITLNDLLEDPEASQERYLDEVDNQKISTLLLDQLEERERTLLEMTYGLDGGIPGLIRPSEAFNLTNERVRQINRSSLKKLQKIGKNIVGDMFFE